MSTVALGLAGYAATVYLLTVLTPLPWAHSLFLAALIELLPAFAVLQVRLARDLVVERDRAYLASAVTVGILGVASSILGIRLVGADGTGLGIGGGGLAGVVSWSAVTFMLSVATLGLFLAMRKAAGWGETRLVRELMPVSGREKGLFVGLSMCAGFGEELAYRGYAIPALVVAGASVPLALAITSVAFGLLHAYQGWLGVARTGVVGVIMGVVFLYAGSVWPPVIGHVLVDLAVGFILADRLLA